MKKLFLTFLFGLIAIGISAQVKHFPTMFAHRGCWTMNEEKEFVIPENSVAAVAMAKKMGYTGIECDVHYTKDKVMVILHDNTLNRTTRLAKDYSPLKEPVKLSDVTFEELRNNYVLASTNPELRTPVPTLKELLDECKKQGIVPMLHSALEESFRMAQEMFGDGWVCFTSDQKQIQKAREFSNCIALLAINDGTPEANIERLKTIGGHCGISTMNYKLLTSEFSQTMTSQGYIVQASIFPAPHEATGQRNGITYQLTDFSFMPTSQQKPIETINLKKKETLPDETIGMGGFLIELKVKGKAQLTIDGKTTYPIESDGKETLYIGHRFFDRSLPAITIQGEDMKLKKMKVKVYDLTHSPSND